MNTLSLGVLIISVVVFVLYAFIRARARALMMEGIRSLGAGVFEISAKVFYIGLACNVLGLVELGAGLSFSTSVLFTWGIVSSLIGLALASHYLSNSLACEWARSPMIGLPKLKPAIVSFLLGLIAISLNALFYG